MVKLLPPKGTRDSFSKTAGSSARKATGIRGMAQPARMVLLAVFSALATTQLLPRDCAFLPFELSDHPFRRRSLANNDQSAPSSQNGDDFKLASYQSYGFFDDIPSKDWKLYQQRFQTHKDHVDDSRPNPSLRALPAIFYMNNYDPVFTCPHPRRLGGVGDGPKWTCDPNRLERVARERQEKTQNGAQSGDSQQQTNCLIYSIGSAGKYEWEVALARFFMKEGQETLQTTCEIHVFDYSKDYTIPGHAEVLNIHFHQWGLKSSYDDSLPKAFKMREPALRRLFTLPEMMAKLGHTHHTIDILKVDCEFCEWFTYRDWLKPDLNIRQLLIETHNLPTSLPDPQQNKGGRFFPVSTDVAPSQFFDDIENAGFAMYSKEPNIHPQAQGNGVEFAYVKLHPDFFEAKGGNH
ncbi:Pfam:DUF672 [Seminavis robusta]|uniref:Pfam:DUF672 n=1 Tax=Seminavis robusta TaxID=568900 RepID=A0A9N8H2K7_9STRA|nr:Pfam:DUF672 [Seminavis robusta]|eukprot:Sro20_g014350.1 Pfam:DUF672 (407) ;mRNA; r:147156-148467